MTPGVPLASTASTNVAFIEVISWRPLMMAKAMRWVKDTLAPVVRPSDSFSEARLISSRRAATVRTLVAVGTRKEASMLVTMRAAAPRNGVAAAFTSTGLGAGAAATAWVVATVGTGERW